jgi:hypothetical protein
VYLFRLLPNELFEAEDRFELRPELCVRDLLPALRTAEKACKHKHEAPVDSVSFALSNQSSPNTCM